MSIAFRIISGALGLACLVGTAVFALSLLSMGHDAKVLLAAYMGIGGALVGGYLVFFAIKGK